MPRPVCLVVLSFWCLVVAGGAFARGPVFAVVPTGTGAGPLRQAILDRVGEEKRALQAARRERGRNATLLSRARAQTVRAADPFAAGTRRRGSSRSSPPTRAGSTGSLAGCRVSSSL